MCRYILSDDFVDKIKHTYTLLDGEQETKNNLIEPLLARLGYDVNNVSDIRTEVECGVGIRKEKADYIIQFDKPIMIVEAKDWRVSLDKKKTNQLFRYFCSSNCKLGILTNGLQYHFYSDFQRDNIMDTRPFHVINVLYPKDEDEALLTAICKTRQCTYSIDQWILEQKIRRRLVNNKEKMCDLITSALYVQQNSLSRQQLSTVVLNALK